MAGKGAFDTLLRRALQPFVTTDVSAGTKGHRKGVLPYRGNGIDLNLDPRSEHLFCKHAISVLGFARFTIDALEAS